MKRKIYLIIKINLFFILLASTDVAVLAVGGSAETPKSNYLSCEEQETEWKRVNPQGEEFSVLTPVTPVLIKLGTDYTMSGSYETVQEHRSYGGYAGDFIFFIESYKAARPQRLYKALDEGWYQRRIFESGIEIDGFSGKQYRLDYQNFYGKALSVVTKRHVYLITLASKDETSATVARFISSLKLGDNLAEPDAGQVFNVKDSPHYKSALSNESDTAQPQDQVFNPKAVSRKAMIVSKPEPIYTDEARRNQVVGTVVLRGVFGADGQVKNIKVMRGLESGLTGKAVEAALALRFFPAEKDGQPVSQYIQIEYNFNLY